MSEYSLLEKIKIRLDEYDVITPAGGGETLVFHTGKIDYKLNNLIDKARKDIIGYRHYPQRYTEEMIDDVLTRFDRVFQSCGKLDIE